LQDYARPDHPKEEAMKFFAPAVLTYLITATLPACTTVGRGMVSEKTGADEIHVKLGSADGLVIGQRVAFIDQNCSYRGSSDSQACDPDKAGGGTVLKVLGQHESLVQTDKGVSVQDGQTVVPQLAH
jgi:hypothetical protein